MIQGGNATSRSTTPPPPQNPTTEQDLQTAARDLREAIRSNVRQEISAARARAAADAQATTPVPPTAPVGPITIRGPDGRTTVIGVPSGPFRNNDIPPAAVDISIAFFLTVAAIIIGLPLARAFARRMDRRGGSAQIPNDVAGQLNQLNQAVDAIALEVERISEGQRFTTRLLTEQREAKQTLPSAPR